MVNITFFKSDEAEAGVVLAKMYPAAAEFIQKLSIEAGSTIVLDDQLDAKTSIRVRITALPSPGEAEKPT